MSRLQITYFPIIWLISNYFVLKIERINDSLDALQSSESLDGDDDASADNMGA